MAIRARCDIRPDEMDYSMNSFRKAAYRQYILWRYKNLGRGKQKSMPIMCGASNYAGVPSRGWTVHGISKSIKIATIDFSSGYV